MRSKTKSTPVVACSALKRSYRERLIVNPAAVKLVYLKGEPRLISRRLARRRHHFMSQDLLASQFDTLEEPTDAIVVDVAQSTAAVVRNIQQELACNLIDAGGRSLRKRGEA
jgi:gluconokinase